MVKDQKIMSSEKYDKNLNKAVLAGIERRGNGFSRYLGEMVDAGDML